MLLKQLKHTNPVAETTTHTKEVVTQSVVNDVETQKKLLHSLRSTMLKHRSRYTVHDQ
jgi:hypothetical protein